MGILNPEMKCTLKPEVVSDIQKLHQANIDSAKGFEETAKDLKDEQLADNFCKWSSERSAQATELAELVECNAESVDHESSWLSALHRAYTSMRAAVSYDDKHALLAEAERGEDHIKAAYEEVLKETPGSAVNDILQRQYARVKATHDCVRDLRDACKRC